MASATGGNISPNTLKRLYTEERLSSWSMADQCGISRSHVFALLRHYSIPVRTPAEAHRKYDRRPFTGSLAEKAYLLGFAIGDLRVRMQHKNGETISVACSSTHPAQISLIQELFSPYGRVWIGSPNSRGVVSCEAYVDLSFKFLLPEHRSVDWVFNRSDSFFGFLAGFTDAEGSLFISGQGKATITWGQYDGELLGSIKRTLDTYAIQTGNVINDHLAGYQGRDGYVRQKDYCHLTCTKRASLGKLLDSLEPHLRHQEKREALIRLSVYISTSKQKLKT